MIRFRSHLTRPGCVATVVGLFLLSVGVFYLMWNERTHRESEHFVTQARLYTVKVYGHLVPGERIRHEIVQELFIVVLVRAIQQEDVAALPAPDAAGLAGELADAEAHVPRVCF